MKFKAYLNESFENKIFSAIDSIMKLNDIKNFSDILKLPQFNKFIRDLSDEFRINIKIFAEDCKAISGGTDEDGIVIRVPSDIKDTKKDLMEVLSVIFHELAHEMQFRDAAEKLGPTIIKAKDDYVKYFIQRIERSPQAMSISMISLLNDVNLLKLIEDIKNDCKNVKNIDELEDKLEEYRQEYILKHKRFKIWNLIYVGFSIYAERFLQGRNKELENKLEVLFKNIIKSYTILERYFKKYGITK